MGINALWNSTAHSSCLVKNSAGEPKGKKAISEINGVIRPCQLALHHYNKLLR